MIALQRILTSAIILLSSFILMIKPSEASVQIEGKLKAQKTCEAVQSIRMGTNPGNIHLVKGKTYEVIGKDRNIESHYLIKIPDQDITPSVRWIAKNCGRLVKK